MTDKIQASAQDIAGAAFYGWMALTAELTRKGVISNDDSNAIAATAASMCEAGGLTVSAEVIRASIPTSRDVDPVARALDVGMKVTRQPED